MKRDETSIRKTKAGVLVYLYAKSIDEQVEVGPASIHNISSCSLIRD